MKNLKKILCVVLVAAMMLGIVAVASAAAPVGSDAYDDYDKIANKDAVDFLTELEIIDGFDDGNYHPDYNLTRAQMAKIVAYIIAQPKLTVNTTIEKYLSAYAGTVTFKDVAADKWYAGSIGYDQYSGIVDGDDGVSFRPEDNVKIIEAAKMLLVVLGYDADEAGLVGSNWVGNTLTLGLKKGLFDGIDTTDVNRKITRDEMAQMTYNALVATMVGYVKTDKGLFEIDQINDLAQIFGNNFNYWNNSDLFVGKQAIQYYFGKDVAVTTGIVIANSYTNLGKVEDTDSYGYETVEYKTVDRAGVSVTLEAEYDPDFETVIYIPAGVCIGTGYCSGAHNEANSNCPATTDEAMLLVVDYVTCIDEIGREVKLSALANVNQFVTYDSLVVTANNSAEFVCENGFVNDNAEIKLAAGTIWTGIFNCGDSPYTYDYTEYEKLVAADLTSKASTKAFNRNGFMHYNISNNNDAVAEFSITIEQVLGTVTAIDETTGVVTVTDVYDDDYCIEYVHDGVELARGDVVLFYYGICHDYDDNGCAFVEVLEKHTGVIDSYVGNALDDGAYNKINIDGDDYVVSQICTRNIRDNYRFSIGDSCEYWLDMAGNIVKFKLTDAPSNVKALIYGIERTSAVFADTDATIYTINTIDAAGNEAKYEITNETMYSDEVAEYIWNNTRAVYADIEFARDGTVIAIDRATNVNGTTYTKATLVLGSESLITKITNATSVLFTAIDDVTGYVNDSTVFFNFTIGFGGYFQPDGETLPDSDISLETWNNLVAQSAVNKIGSVVISKGPATVGDIAEGSTYGFVDAITGVGDIASIVVLPIARTYAAMAPIANKSVDKTDIYYNAEYIYVSMDDMSHATRVWSGEYDDNGNETYLYTIPCSGARESITVTAPVQHIIASSCVANGAVCVVNNVAGYKVDFVVPVMRLYAATIGATVKSDSENMDRLALQSLYVAELYGAEADEDGWVNFGDFALNQDYIDLISGVLGKDVWTSSYTDDSIIYNVNFETGTMTRIAGDDINVNDTILYIPVDALLAETTAAAFADTISVGFVFTIA